MNEYLFLCKRFQLEEKPPIPCEFSIGDKVIFTNDYNVQFNEVVIGFSKEVSYGRFIHTIPDKVGGFESYWFPKNPNQLRKRQSVADIKTISNDYGF